MSLDPRVLGMLAQKASAKDVQALSAQVADVAQKVDAASAPIDIAAVDFEKVVTDEAGRLV